MKYFVWWWFSHWKIYFFSWSLRVIVIMSFSRHPFLSELLSHWGVHKSLLKVWRRRISFGGWRFLMVKDLSNRWGSHVLLVNDLGRCKGSCFRLRLLFRRRLNRSCWTYGSFWRKIVNISVRLWEISLLLIFDRGYLLNMRRGRGSWWYWNFMTSEFRRRWIFWVNRYLRNLDLELNSKLMI